MIDVCPGDDNMLDDPDSSDELNWAIRQTFHEPNSLSLVCLMKSLTFGLGITLTLDDTCKRVELFFPLLMLALDWKAMNKKI